MGKLIRGVGTASKGTYPIWLGDKQSREYRIWYGMLDRCYNPKTWAKRPNYIDCIVCDRWLDFQNFAHDVNNMIGWNEKDKEGLYYELDKDILIEGNKVYSPETCLLVPRIINQWGCVREYNRKPQKNGRYRVQYHLWDKQLQVGYVDTLEEARHIYSIKKQDTLIEYVLYYRDTLDKRLVQKVLGTPN